MDGILAQERKGVEENKEAKSYSKDLHPHSFTLFLDHLVRVPLDYKNVELCFCLQGEGRLLTEIQP